VDGRATAVTADRGIFQAVPLPAGESHVVFSYTPPWEGYAWIAFGAGLVGIAGRKKLFSVIASPGLPRRQGAARNKGRQKFLGPFFQKRTASFLTPR
jgi:hypothetical protein